MIMPLADPLYPRDIEAAYTLLVVESLIWINSQRSKILKETIDLPRPLSGLSIPLIAEPLLTCPTCDKHSPS